jgi:PAS domain S-box-containing protein
MGTGTEAVSESIHASASEAEERGRLAVELGGAAVLTLDAALCIVYANAAAAELLGAPASALAGRPFEALFAEADRERQRGAVSAAFAQAAPGARWRGALALAPQRGGVVRVEAAIAEHASAPRRLTVLLRPPDARRGDALALAARSLSALTGESFFRAVVQDLGGMLHADYVLVGELLPGRTRIRTRALFAEGRLAPVVEYDLAGTPCEHLLSSASCGYPRAVQELFPGDAALVAWGAQAYAGAPLLDSTGQRIGLLAALYRDEQADLAPAQALLEIFAARAGAELERQQAERALRDREERLELALWGTGLGMWDWDVARGEIVCDAQYEAMLGFGRGEAPRAVADWELSVHPDDRADVMRRLREHLEGRAGEYESTHRLRTSNGGWKWILDRGKVVSRDEGGCALRMVGTHLDVSDHRRLEEQLAQAQKMDAIGRLAGGVAHDFNNLLTSILSAAEFATEVVPVGSAALEDLAVVREAAQRAAELTRQLLAFARKQVVAPRVVALPALFAETERMLRRMLGEDVEIATRTPADVWPVRVDPSQFQQVLVNLAVNARAAMQRGGRLTLELRNVQVSGGDAGEVSAGDWVLLAVSDTGAGMSAETMARVFEPFFTTKEPGRGTGLGLAMVYGTVKQAGGHISVASEVGHGTRFEILLPRAGGAPEEVPRSAAAARGGGETILLVEDDALVLDMNTRALAALGYEVLPCRAGDEALGRARTHRGRIDLLVTDVVMPRMSGPTVARALGALRPGLRTLFVSGYAEELAAGGLPNASFLPKPFTPRALAARIRELLDAPAAAPATASASAAAPARRAPTRAEAATVTIDAAELRDLQNLLKTK